MTFELNSRVVAPNGDIRIGYAVLESAGDYNYALPSTQQEPWQHADAALAEIKAFLADLKGPPDENGNPMLGYELDVQAISGAWLLAGPLWIFFVPWIKIRL